MKVKICPHAYQQDSHQCKAGWQACLLVALTHSAQMMPQSKSALDPQPEMKTGELIDAAI